MYKYVQNSVVKISMMFAKYLEYYTIILRGSVFCGRAVVQDRERYRYSEKHIGCGL